MDETPEAIEDKKRLEDIINMAKEIFGQESIFSDDSLGSLGFSVIDRNNYNEQCVVVSPLLKTITVGHPRYFQKALKLGERIEARYPIEIELYENYKVEPPIA